MLIQRVTHVNTIKPYFNETQILKDENTLPLRDIHEFDRKTTVIRQNVNNKNLNPISYQSRPSAID